MRLTSWLLLEPPYQPVVSHLPGVLSAYGRLEQATARLDRPEDRFKALKAMRLEGYAPRAPCGPSLLQPALFPYAEAF